MLKGPLNKLLDSSGSSRNHSTIKNAKTQEALQKQLF
jgi:hypothetical protein